VTKHTFPKSLTQKSVFRSITPGGLPSGLLSTFGKHRGDHKKNGEETREDHIDPAKKEGDIRGKRRVMITKGERRKCRPEPEGGVAHQIL